MQTYIHNYACMYVHIYILPDVILFLENPLNTAHTLCHTLQDEPNAPKKKPKTTYKIVKCKMQNQAKMHKKSAMQQKDASQLEQR